MNITRLAVENVSKFGIYVQFAVVSKQETAIHTNAEVEKAIKKRGNSGSCPSFAT
jgi:hypothetical protein